MYVRVGFQTVQIAVHDNNYCRMEIIIVMWKMLDFFCLYFYSGAGFRCVPSFCAASRGLHMFEAFFFVVLLLLKTTIQRVSMWNGE